MNQNPPPRGPGNPFDGAERRDELGNQNPMGRPAPPLGGQTPPGPVPMRPPHPGGPPPVSPGGPPPMPGAPMPPGPGGYPPPGGPMPGAPMPMHGGPPMGGPMPGHYPPPHVPGHGHDTAVMSTKEWVLTFLIFLVPCVNLIMLFVWAFSGSGNLNRRNYARAYLIVIGIGIAIYLLFALIFGAAMFSVFRYW